MKLNVTEVLNELDKETNGEYRYDSPYDFSEDMGYDDMRKMEDSTEQFLNSCVAEAFEDVPRPYSPTRRSVRARTSMKVRIWTDESISRAAFKKRWEKRLENFYY